MYPYCRTPVLCAPRPLENIPNSARSNPKPFKLPVPCPTAPTTLPFSSALPFCAHLGLCGDLLGLNLWRIVRRVVVALQRSRRRGRARGVSREHKVLGRCLGCGGEGGVLLIHLVRAQVAQDVL